MNTLHIFNDPKFSEDYFEFLIEQGFDLSSHCLFHYRTRARDSQRFPLKSSHSPSFFSLLPNLRLLPLLFKADKIIIHCLAAPALVFYLFLFPSLCRKCYWVIWGKDLYLFHFEKNKRLYHYLFEFFRKRVIFRIPYVVSNNEGDLAYASQWYGLDAHAFPSFSYPSNLFKEPRYLPRLRTDKTLLLIGNSADPSNHHARIFEILKAFSEKNVELVVPLAYGNQTYSKQVIKLGEKIFGRKFRPLLDLIPMDEYLALLERVDIGVFAHERQQAVGTINTLVGFGKKVYLSPVSSVRDQMNALDIVTYDLSAFDLEPIDPEIARHNRNTAKDYFSRSSLASQWREIFKHDPRQMS
ncbi:MAG: TDP-N-acetylfucosamine:lipid II N-acetylfucosaminyltransferase [Pseudomonadota bacterium]|nr:MAG: TDP-N-acetylfucosamine:lipid II N-acetylfucosaminyltransferase [Pseudomonadota bacterium]